MSLKERFGNAWNAFVAEDKRRDEQLDSGPLFGNFESSSRFRQDRYRMAWSSEHSFLNSIYNRIANDVASIQIQHVRVDANGRFLEVVKSGLNNCMTLSANLDQTSRDFWTDIVLSMLDEGVVAAVPTDVDVDLLKNNSIDILSLRAGHIVDWQPSKIKMEVYNERKGVQEQITLPKDKVAILENPFYSIMNEPNSTLKRLINKMNLLDQIDGQKASSKLNLLVQLPYSLKSPARIKQAEERRKVLEDQLSDSRYGVGYIDSTEHVTQLNRAIENDLPQQIEYLTNQLYSQIGIGAEVFNGTASPQQMLIYNKKVLKPILDLIEQEFTRKFLTKTARTQGQKVSYYIDAFDLVTADEVANMANAFGRNEILSPNEVRAILGFKANDDPKSDELSNRNMPSNNTQPIQQGNPADASLTEALGGGEIDELEALLNETENDTDLDETERLLDELDASLNE
jgi:hypothetical protein